MKKYKKAQMWDKMQYLFGAYYDRMIHISAIMQGQIDTKCFAQAVDILLYKIDILRCRYITSAVRPYWQLNENYNANDCITIIDSEDIEGEINNALIQKIPLSSDFQIKFTVINGKNRCGYAILLNHMCADGSDTKYLMGKLMELYKDIKNGGNGSGVHIKQGSRDNDQLYDRMPVDTAKKATKLYKNISQSKVKVSFPLTATNGKERVQIFKIHMPDNFLSMLSIARKKHSATVNDIYLAAFFRTVYKYLCGKEKSLNIISMVDLRRYCGDTLGVTNLTGFAPCHIDMANENFVATLNKVKNVMNKHKADEFMGLYSLPLLKLAFMVFPYAISELAIKIGYQNPLIGMSNIGILPNENFQLQDTILTEVFMTGATKYKPYMQLTTSTCLNKVTFAIAEKCNRKDAVILQQFLIDYKKELLNFVTLT